MISDIKFGALTGSTSTTVTAPGTHAQATTLAGTPVEKSLSFIYGPEHQRIKQVAVGGPNPGTTWYLNGEDSLGLTYEKELKSTGITEHKHYLQAGGITFAMHTMRVKTAGCPSPAHRHSRLQQCLPAPRPARQHHRHHQQRRHGGRATGL